MSLIIEGATEKVLQFVIQRTRTFVLMNKNVFFNIAEAFKEQKYLYNYIFNVFLNVLFTIPVLPSITLCLYFIKMHKVELKSIPTTP
jgi:hypothetical protein